MAVTKGRIRLADGTEHHITLTLGDKLRAKQWRAQQIAQGEATPDQDTLTAYMYHLACKRHDVGAHELEFWAWADTVLDFEMDITHEFIDGLIAAGSITDDAAEKLRAIAVDEDDFAEADAGEA